MNHYGPAGGYVRLMTALRFTGHGDEIPCRVAARLPPSPAVGHKSRRMGGDDVDKRGHEEYVLSLLHITATAVA
jgi:hypothetical protein